MATVSQQNIGNQHEKITVNISKEDYLPVVEKAIRKLSKDAVIPGFRKGMVPVGHVKKLYGQSVFTDEVLKVAGTKLEEHLMETKAEIFARPIPAESQQQYNFDIQNPEDYVFEFEIGTKPSFDISLLTNKTSLPVYKVIVTHDMVDEEIGKLQLKAGEMSEVETVTNDNNVLHVSIKSETGIDTKQSLLLSYFSDKVKNEFMGKKAGDSIELKAEEIFADNIKDSILADLKLTDQKQETITLTIEKIENITKAELNAEMFEKIYPGREIDTEEKFREQLISEMETYWNSQARNFLHNDIFERLVHETNIDIPAPFLKRWMSVGGEKYTPMDVVEKEYGRFEHQLRWQLISDKLIEENKLNVEKEEMEQAARMQIMSYFGQYGSMPSMEADWMDSLVKKQLADKKFADELYNKIITDKLFYVIENSLDLKETNISKDEFVELLNKPHHHHHH